MIKFLKKFKEKILIALACSFIGIGTIFSNTLDTYAYVTSDTSYTLNEPYYDSSLYGGTTIFDLKNSISNAYAHNLYLCINMANPSEIYATAYLYIYSNNSWYSLGSKSYQFFNYNPYTFIMNISTNSNTFQNISKVGVRFNVGFGGTWTNYDFVKGSELTTTYYLDTYVSSYQQQLVQLQNDYDTLESNYNTLVNNYDTLEDNYNTLEDNYNTLESEYEQKQNEYDMLTNGQLGYLDYMDFVINNENIEFGNNGEIELNLNELIEYNLYANNSLNLSYFTTQQVNPNYYPLKIESYYDELPVNLFSMYFNGETSGIIKVGYYSNSQYTLKQISFDNTGTAVDSFNTSLINYEVFKGINVDYIEYIEIQFNNADLIAGSINFNSTYNIAYSSGFTTGYNYGYNVSDNANSEKINNARQEGYQNGYDVGKQDGIQIGSDENNTLYGVVIRVL